MLNDISQLNGRASLYVKIEAGKAREVRLRASQGPRYIEALLKGRHFADAHIIAQRTCGISSTIHTIASVMAVENALGTRVSTQTEKLRQILAIGQLLLSHSYQLYMAILPYYLGYSSFITMSQKYRKEAARGFSLNSLGREIIRVIGGREIHPVNLCVGGFARVPGQNEMSLLQKRLEKARSDVLKTAELFSSLPYKKFKRNTEYISLKAEDTYPLLSGKIMFSNGLEIEPKDYGLYLKESVLPDSFAKTASFENRSYYTGPLARLNNNYDLISRNAQKCIDKGKLSFPSYNPFHNIYAMAIELVHYIDLGIEAMKQLSLVTEKPAEAIARKGRGVAAIESPAGMLIYDYSINQKGLITKADILSPSSQIIRNVEDDMLKLLSRNMSMQDKEIEALAVKLIRSYGLCMSCAVQ